MSKLIQRKIKIKKRTDIIISLKLLIKWFKWNEKDFNEIVKIMFYKYWKLTEDELMDGIE